ncbi:altronate oxidoreductase [compost metagenome]
MDTKEINGAFQTQHTASNFNIQDEYALALYQQWAKGSDHISDVLKSTAIWEQDLSDFPGFATAVVNYIQEISNIGIQAVLKNRSN